MTISYIEKGTGLHAAISAAGHWLEQRDGVWISSNDAAVQAIIDVYNELPDLKAAKIDTIKSEGVARAKVIFPSITDFATLDLIAQLVLSISSSARAPTPRITSLGAIWTAGSNAAAAVNAATTPAQIAAVTVNWP
jgi:hypothetical protein